jgi:hypothetical protein
MNESSQRPGRPPPARSHARLPVLGVLAVGLLIVPWLLLRTLSAQAPVPALPGEKPARPPERSATPRPPLLTPEPGFARVRPEPTETPAAPPVVEKTERQTGAEGDATAAALPARGAWTPGSRTFRIGYIPGTPEEGLDEALAHRLAKALERDPALAEAFRAAGFSGDVAPQPADGYNDLATRLLHEEFDLAFCPAAVFASLLGGYEVILQERRDEDLWDSRGGGQILREGVVFAGPLSPLFRADRLTSSTLRRALREELAVPSSYDTAGYIYPCLALSRSQGISPSSIRFRFCGSSRETVKHVVSGLAQIGACEMTALQRWLVDTAPDLPLEQAVRILPIPISRSPTDPVVIREALGPRHSEAGRKIKGALKKFFSPSGATPFQLVDSRGDYYERLHEDLASLKYLRSEGAAR